MKHRPKRSPQHSPESSYERSRLLEAVKLFNGKEYFECHEILEDIWFDVRDNSRDFFRGLLHIAVGFYHLRNKKNQAGALTQLNKALTRLENYGDDFKGVDLGTLKAEIGDLISVLQENGTPKFFPKIVIE